MINYVMDINMRPQSSPVALPPLGTPHVASGTIRQPASYNYYVDDGVKDHVKAIYI